MLPAKRVPVESHGPGWSSKACDADLELNVGARSLLVRKGYGHIQQHDPAVRPHAVVDDLLAATEWIETEFPR
ncbi:MAG: hypothetical protein JNM18_25065 [Planctomycetaceae bacterium]|nr:hypothetical protein [Planctomycetaceae bacterium]